MHIIGELIAINKKGEYEATGEYAEFDFVKDLFMVTIWSPKRRYFAPLYHTSKGMISPPLTLESVRKAHEHLGIQALDTVNLVMIDNIDEVKDVNGALLAFFKGYNKQASISKPKRKLIDHLIKKLKG